MSATRTIIFLFVFFLLCGLAIDCIGSHEAWAVTSDVGNPQAKESPTHYPDTVIVNVEALNLRDPMNTGNVVGKARKGDRFIISRTTDTHYIVKSPGSVTLRAVTVSPKYVLVRKGGKTPPPDPVSAKPGSADTTNNNAAQGDGSSKLPWTAIILVAAPIAAIVAGIATAIFRGK